MDGLWDIKMSEVFTDLDLDIMQNIWRETFSFIPWRADYLVSILVLNIWCTFSLLNYTWKMDYTHSCINWFLNNNLAKYFSTCCVRNAWNAKPFFQKHGTMSMCAFPTRRQHDWFRDEGLWLFAQHAGLCHGNNQWLINNAVTIWKMNDVRYFADSMYCSVKVISAVEKSRRRKEFCFLAKVSTKSF